MLEKIKMIVENGEYQYYAIRMDDYIYNIDDKCHTSHQWWQDDPEDGSEYVQEMHCWDGGILPGTCAFSVSADNIADVMEEAEETFGYYDHMYLIAGDDAEIGNDPGEIIVDNATVLLVIK